MSQDQLNALVVALMPFLVSLALTLFRVGVSKLPENKQAKVQGVAGIVVTAVEQMYKTMPGSGEQKKAEALKLATAMLKDLGLKVHPDTLSAYVEVAVHSLPSTVKESPGMPGA